MIKLTLHLWSLSQIRWLFHSFMKFLSPSGILTTLFLMEFTPAGHMYDLPCSFQTESRDLTIMLMITSDKLTLTLNSLRKLNTLIPNGVFCHVNITPLIKSPQFSGIKSLVNLYTVTLMIIFASSFIFTSRNTCHVNNYLWHFPQIITSGDISI